MDGLDRAVRRRVKRFDSQCLHDERGAEQIGAKYSGGIKRVIDKSVKHGSSYAKEEFGEPLEAKSDNEELSLIEQIGVAGAIEPVSPYVVDFVLNESEYVQGALAQRSTSGGVEEVHYVRGAGVVGFNVRGLSLQDHLREFASQSTPRPS